MPNRSLTDRITVTRHYNGSYSSTETPSTGVDVAALHTAEIIVDVGAAASLGDSPGAGSWAFTLEHSDTSNASFAAVTSADVALQNGDDLGASGLFLTIDASSEDDAAYHLGYVGSKRYLRVVATAADTPGSTPICVHVVGEPRLS